MSVYSYEKTKKKIMELFCERHGISNYVFCLAQEALEGWEDH